MNTKIIEFEGAKVTICAQSIESEAYDKRPHSLDCQGNCRLPEDYPLKPGDTYMAVRNTGWKLLTCATVNANQKYVVPEENAYCFDTWECYRVLNIA